MHPADAALAGTGGPVRPITAAPGLLRHILYRLLYDPKLRVEPVAIDQAIHHGDVLPIAGGIEVIHAPGHCAGQVALLWRPGGMLFGADVFMNLAGPGDPLGFKDIAVGRASQRRLAALDFAAVGFGHGKPITRNAAARVRRAAGGAARPTA